MSDRFLKLLALLLPLAAAMPSWGLEDDFLHPDEAFAPSLVAVDGAVEARWEIADGYYLYRDKFRLDSETPGVKLGEVAFPPAKTKSDPNFGDTEVYYKGVKLTAPLIDGSGEAQIRLTYQGCAESGLCYPPQRKSLRVALAAADEDASIDAPLLGGGGTLSEQLGLGFDDGVLPASEAFKLGSIVQSGNSVKLVWELADGIYMYADKIKLALEGEARLGDYDLPEPRIIRGLTPDGEEGDVAVYYHRLSVDVPLLRTSKEAAGVTLHVDYQGCAEQQGICYPPQKAALQLELPAVDQVDVSAATPPAPAVQQSPQDQQAAEKSAGNAAAAAACAERQGLSTVAGMGVWAIVAVCFLIGSLLMVPETALEERSPDGRQNSQRTSQPTSH